MQASLEMQPAYSLSPTHTAPLTVHTTIPSYLHWEWQAHPMLVLFPPNAACHTLRCHPQTWSLTLYSSETSLLNTLGGISSLFFAFADIIIHNIFNTDFSVKGWTTNSASSYLDLSPLYGSSQDVVNSVRKLDGTGRLHEDVFADPRLINMPPAVGVLLILFNRNHNVSLRTQSPFPPASSFFKVCGGKNSFHQREWELQESSAH